MMKVTLEAGGYFYLFEVPAMWEIPSCLEYGIDVKTFI